MARMEEALELALELGLELGPGHKGTNMGHGTWDTTGAEPDPEHHGGRFTVRSDVNDE
jgi:hypothetical protein